ncbi:type II toxin-antitoxin system antitoxin DNA ADP-ribosyl glycohydrolase DarG [Rheinheimera gaetbuli]
MTIESSTGDLLKQQDVDAIVNTVNCVGVMGKGIALQFKKKWPANFKAYTAACKAGEIRLGKMFIFDLGALATPRYIINFPTKDHWRNASNLKDIETGLQDLVLQIKNLDIRSIAMPPLGCGNGGLSWSDVRPVIEQYFASLTHVTVRLFEPSDTAATAQLEVNTAAPKMTAGRAAILALLECYEALSYGLSKLEVQKLAYFLQEAGEDLKLSYQKHKFGPYADQLRHVLDRMDGHYIHGVGDGVVESAITPDTLALKTAKAFLAKANPELQARVKRVAQLIDGFQSPFGMELLASVHWVAKQEGAADAQQALQKIQSWNPRKSQLMQANHVESAWQQLQQQRWV